MKFIVIESGGAAPKLKTYPIGILRRDPWDDFGIQSTFFLEVFLSKGRSEHIGDVKILRRGQTEGKTPLPDKSFSILPREYYSLGQSYSYYEALVGLGIRVRRNVMQALRDIVVRRGMISRLKQETAFNRSMLRASSAVIALKGARPLILKGDSWRGAKSFEFVFKTQVGGSSFNIDFDFRVSRDLPSRVNAIIGYNGTGKTQLLANLAMASVADSSRFKKSSRKIGTFVRKDVRFSSVLAISYSAFDTFELPGWSEIEKDRLQRHGSVFGYAYCGLRKFSQNHAGKMPIEYDLKSISEIEGDFQTAVRRASAKGRGPLFRAAMKPLLRETSFERLGLFGSKHPNRADLVKSFPALSTGHKIALNVVAQLVALLDRHSLVLFDEPESHLHPPLLAALLRSLRIILDHTASFAVVATHSPVVLQETPARHVRVLKRYGLSTSIALPTMETFGESIGLLTQHAFDLDSSATDFHEVLDRLAAKYSPTTIASLFGGRLSSQARAYLLSKQS